MLRSMDNYNSRVVTNNYWKMRRPTAEAKVEVVLVIIIFDGALSMLPHKIISRIASFGGLPEYCVSTVYPCVRSLEILHQLLPWSRACRGDP